MITWWFAPLDDRLATPKKAELRISMSSFSMSRAKSLTTPHSTTCGWLTRVAQTLVRLKTA